MPFQRLLVELLVEGSFVRQHPNNGGPSVFGVLDQFLSNQASLIQLPRESRPVETTTDSLESECT